MPRRLPLEELQKKIGIKIGNYVAQGVKREVDRQLNHAFKSPKEHFAPLRNQFKGTWQTWYPPSREYTDAGLISSLKGIGYSNREISDYFAAHNAGMSYYPGMDPSHIPYRNETHAAIFHRNYPAGTFGTDAMEKDVESMAYKSYEEVPENQKDIYHKGATKYNFGRRRNLSRRAANRQSIIRLSRGRYHY